MTHRNSSKHSKKNYSNLHPKKIIELKEPILKDAKMPPLIKKEYKKKLTKEALEKARLKISKRKK